MTSVVSVLSDLSVSSSGSQFSPSLGTLVIKDHNLYGYVLVNGVETWYPLVRSTTQTFQYIQQNASRSWIVQHNLNTVDIWYQIHGADGSIINPDNLTFIDNNSFRLTFTNEIIGNVVVVGTSAVVIPSIKAQVIDVGTNVHIDNSGMTIDGLPVLTSVVTSIGDGVTTQITYSNSERFDIVAGDGIDIVYDDILNKITLSSFGGSSGGITIAEIDSLIAAALLVAYANATPSSAGLMSATDKGLFDQLAATTSGTNTGDETAATIKSKLGISMLFGNNTGDQTLASLGIVNVENKSSSTIRSELTKLNVTTALGFTPLNGALVGVANGYATLDVAGKLTNSQIPASLLGALNYQGVWNATTNTPTLVSSIGSKGYYYKVSTTGATNLNNTNQWSVGDIVVFNGTTWDKISGGATEVTMVAGRVGEIVLTMADISDAPASLSIDTTNASNLTKGTLSETRLPAFSGDATSPVGVATLTLANTGVVNGSYGTNIATPTFTVDSKGRITAASIVNITPPFTSITGKPTTLAGYGITDAASITGISFSSIINKPTTMVGYGITDSVILGAQIGLPLGITGAVGASLSAAHSDHTHALPVLDILNNVQITTKLAGDALVWNGAKWINSPQSAVASASANKLASPRTIAATGDATGSTLFDGSTDVAVNLILANTGVSFGVYGGPTAIPVFTVDSKGRLTSAGTVGITQSFANLTDKPTTAVGFGITDIVTLGTIIGAPLGTAAIGNSVTAAHADHVHALPNVDSLANVTMGPKTFGDVISWNGSVWVNSPQASSVSTSAAKLATARAIALSGDATGTVNFDGTANAVIPLVLANTAVTPGAYGSATSTPTFTTDSKGRITSAAATTVTPAFASITGKPTTLAGYGITDAASSSGMAFSLITARPTTLAGYGITDAASASGMAFNLITGKPTTLAGYGITDAASSSGMAFNLITSKPTTLAGYGITDGTTLGSTVGIANGVAIAGVATTAARSDHVHPSATFASITTKPTTISGYGITDAATLGSNTFTGSQSYTEVDKGTIASGTVTFTISAASVQRLQVGGALTIALAGFPVASIFGEMVIELINGGAAIVTWPTINWVTSTGATTTIFASNGITLQIAGTDWVMLWSRDGGTTIYGKIIR